MRTTFMALGLMVGLTACFEDGGYDTGDSGISGCCFYACDDGETSGWVLADGLSECSVLAEDACAGGGLQVSDWQYDGECDGRCDDCDPGL